jgi:hypothetical protein
MQQLAQQVGLAEAGDAVAAGSTIDDEGVVIDTQNYEGCVFATKITDSVITGVAKLIVEQSVDTNKANMAELAGATATLTSGANDDLNGKWLIVDVFRPAERYLMARRTSATANIAFGDVLAILYGKKGKLPVTDPTSVGHKVVVASPAEA